MMLFPSPRLRVPLPTLRRILSHTLRVIGKSFDLVGGLPPAMVAVHA